MKLYSVWSVSGSPRGREWGNMGTTTVILLVAWLGLNAAFVAMRFYVTSERRLASERRRGAPFKKASANIQASSNIQDGILDRAGIQ